METLSLQEFKSILFFYSTAFQYKNLHIEYHDTLWNNKIEILYINEIKFWREYSLTQKCKEDTQVLVKPTLCVFYEIVLIAACIYNVFNVW